jgi:hypothetical protein
MLSADEIRTFYKYAPFRIPPLWNLSRKHYRLVTLNRKFLKLNKFENRINNRELRKYCVKYVPAHVYMSVMDWLFPERVGKKYKANYCVPVSSQFVIDIDAHDRRKYHWYHICESKPCPECLELARRLTIQACEILEQYYSKIVIVFSGNQGFHIWILDYNFHDWTHYNEKDPIKSFEVARFKFTKLLISQMYCFDRHHFILSVDPMHVLTVPGSLNGESGFICRLMGRRQELEGVTIPEIMQLSNPTLIIYSHAEAYKPMKTSNNS